MLNLENGFTCRSYDSDMLENFPNNFFVTHHNIRSFNLHFDEFYSIFSETSINIDIAVFSETWFTKYSCSPILGYDAYHTIRTDKNCGGISTYIKSVYKSRKLNHCSGIYNSFEACTIEPNISANFCIAVLDI